VGSPSTAAAIARRHPWRTVIGLVVTAVAVALATIVAMLLDLLAPAALEVAAAGALIGVGVGSAVEQLEVAARPSRVRSHSSSTRVAERAGYSRSRPMPSSLPRSVGSTSLVCPDSSVFADRSRLARRHASCRRCAAASGTSRAARAASRASRVDVVRGAGHRARVRAATPARAIRRR
jgi:hypothetical protein